MHTKVAILIRDLQQKGGGETNVLTLTEGLNNNGIIPHIFSENNLTKKELVDFYGKEVLYSYKSFPRPKTNFGRFAAELLLSHPLKKELESYQTIYDFTNKPPALQNHPNYIKYLYIYKDNRALSKSKLRNFQFNLYEFLSKIGIKKFNRIPDGITTVTQSKFAQNEILKNTGKKLSIIYPPVNQRKFKPHKKRKKHVITLGRCSEEKNQQLILEIAPHFPNIDFIIVGKNCRKINQTKKIKNIKTLNALSSKKVISLLETALVYFAPTIDEHFGISVVEAIAAGCIPLTHDSGGHTETVPEKSLRFKTKNEAIKKLKKILENPEEFAQKIKPNKKFDKERYIESMIKFVHD